MLQGCRFRGVLSDSPAGNVPAAGTNRVSPHFLERHARLRPGSDRAGHLNRAVSVEKAKIVISETFETPPQPGVAERALDTATDMSRSLGEIVGTLSAAVDRLSAVAKDAHRPGTALSTLSAITREAPLASLFVAFLCGVAVARRR